MKSNVPVHKILALYIACVNSECLDEPARPRLVSAFARIHTVSM